jgi:hypothetical protein
MKRYGETKKLSSFFCLITSSFLRFQQNLAQISVILLEQQLLILGIFMLKSLLSQNPTHHPFRTNFECKLGTNT